MVKDLKMAMIRERNSKLTGGSLMALISLVENNKVIESPLPRLILPGCEEVREGQLVLLDEEGQISEEVLLPSMGDHIDEICILHHYYKTKRNEIPKNVIISEERDRCSFILVNLEIIYKFCKSFNRNPVSSSHEKKKVNVAVIGN